MQTGRAPAGPGGLRRRLARLEDQNAGLREEQQRLEAERERLRGENERLRAERERLQELNERLRGEVEALRRAAKRQAAPFSKGDPAPHPKRPGRKPGTAYGTRVHRRAPAHVDQVVTVGFAGMLPPLRRGADAGTGGDPVSGGATAGPAAGDPL
jgi:FtsZ-binding cell division protein ZapB